MGAEVVFKGFGGRPPCRTSPWRIGVFEEMSVMYELRATALRHDCVALLILDGDAHPGVIGWLPTQGPLLAGLKPDVALTNISDMQCPVSDVLYFRSWLPCAVTQCIGRTSGVRALLGSRSVLSHAVW
jgi:hypothetical protein